MYSFFSTFIIVAAILYIFHELCKKGLIEKLFSNSALQYKDFSINLGSKVGISSREQVNQTRHFEMLRAFQSQSITSEEKLIRSQIKEAGLNLQESNTILIHHLANYSWLICMIDIDQVIYPEQISMLFYLNAQKKACNELELMQFYEKYRERTSQAEDYKYEYFLNYLIIKNLITKDLNGYTITQKGKEYLTFCIKIGKAIK